jgi:hypothetical protein
VLRFWWIPVIAMALAVGYVTSAQPSVDAAQPSNDGTQPSADAAQSSADGSVSNSRTVDVYDLRAGDCFTTPVYSDLFDDAAMEVEDVPCDEPHYFEVFAVRNYGGSVYPASQAQVEVAFEEVCLGPFEAYVGLPYEQSALWGWGLPPTRARWDRGDREFICYLYQYTETRMGESQRGANR